MSQDTTTPEKGTSLWSDAYTRLKKNKLALFGGITILVILFVCYILGFTLQLLGFDGNTQDLNQRFAGPSTDALLGRDQLGRDFFMRIIQGGQISLLVALLATSITVFIGMIYGGVAGYVGGKTEAIMMRIVDGLLAMPFLIIVILFREVIGGYVNEASVFVINDWGWDNDTVTRFANLIPLIFAIAGFGWLVMGRIVCSAAASLAKQEFVEAARSLGLSDRRILFRHIVPNMLGPVIIYATLTIPSFILYEATLSFIGLGIEPPNSSWGKLINEGSSFLEEQPQLLLYPALVFSLTLFAFNFLGDGLRDALDPKASKD